jgi:hypothetical protein
MNQLTAKQTEIRLQELITRSRQRYLDAGGDPKRCPSGLKGDDYLTDEERKELIFLMRKIAGIKIIDHQVYCQGKSWKLDSNYRI